MTLRTTFFWLHLTAGVVGRNHRLRHVGHRGRADLRAAADQRGRTANSSRTPNSSATRMPVERLVEEFRRQQPDAEPTGGHGRSPTHSSRWPWPWDSAPSTWTPTPDGCWARRTRASGVRCRSCAPGTGGWRWKGPRRPAARAITGWANVLFLGMVASGIYLWLPRRWSWQIGAARWCWFKPGLRGKARDFNWHNAIGIWSAVPLLIVVASAVPISFPWGNALVYRMVGEEPPAPRGGGRGWRSGRSSGRQRQGCAARRARRGVVRRARRRFLAQAAAAGAGLEIDQPPPAGVGRGAGGVRHQSRGRWPTAPAVHVSPQPRRETSSPTSRSLALTTGRRIRNVMRFAHTGEVLGLAGQTVAGLVSAGGASWSGRASHSRCDGSVRGSIGAARNWSRVPSESPRRSYEAGSSSARNCTTTND